jgi:hypothetical protein
MKLLKKLTLESYLKKKKKKKLTNYWLVMVEKSLIKGINKK